MLGVIFSLFLICVPPTVDTTGLLDAMYTVESGRGKTLVGDGGKAIGPYQIWESYWSDAVEFDPSIGGSYKDCMDKAYSEKVIRAYWARYAPKGATLEQLARIHNGGCGILKKEHSTKAKDRKAWDNTTKYWKKILKEMKQ